ncbi:hypothetical protein BH23BAC3_BH23BAC3_22670 [soil metagenome]
MYNKKSTWTRGQVIKYLGGLSGGVILYPGALIKPVHKKNRFKIGACDWSIGKRGELEAFNQAKKIGLDGIQVSFARNEQEIHMLSREIQKEYLQAARRTGVQIGGLALGILNHIPYKSDPRAEQWVLDSIDVADALGCKVILLAFFGEGDIKGDRKGTMEVINRLKKVAPKAEEKNIVLGIESWLSAPEHMEILEAVGSSHVKVYYDVANSNKMGYDIYSEIRWLGDNICEFHAKENGYLLGKGEIDFIEVRKALDYINYSGWIHIEGAIPSGKEIYESYVLNRKFMHSTFDL